MTVVRTAAVIRQWIGAMPTRSDFAQFYIGRFDGTTLRYTDSSGTEYAVAADAVQGSTILRADVPHTLVAVRGRTTYAVASVEPINGT